MPTRTRMATRSRASAAAVVPLPNNAEKNDKTVSGSSLSVKNKKTTSKKRVVSTSRTTTSSTITSNRNHVSPHHDNRNPHAPPKQTKKRAKLEVDASFLVPVSELSNQKTTSLATMAIQRTTKESNTNTTSSSSSSSSPNNKTSSSSSSSSKTASSQTADQIFQKRFEQLQEFKALYGHANPSQSYDSSLYRWCHRKRTSKHPPPQHQIDLLNSINFDWSHRAYNMKSFEERFEELKKFKGVFGHCKVTVRYDSALQVWCQHLKTSFRALKEGSSPHMRLDERQIRLLDELGFEWF